LKIRNFKIYVFLFLSTFCISCYTHKTYYSENTNVKSFDERALRKLPRIVPVKLKITPIPFKEFEKHVQFVNYEEYLNISCYSAAKSFRDSTVFISNPDSSIELQITSEIIDKEVSTLGTFGFLFSLGIIPGRQDATYRIHLKFYDTERNESILEKDYFAQNIAYVSFLSILVGPLYQLFDENVKYGFTDENSKIINHMLSDIEKDFSTEIRNNFDLLNRFYSKKKSYSVVPYRFKDADYRKIGKFFLIYTKTLLTRNNLIVKNKVSKAHNLDKLIEEIENLSEAELFEYYKTDRLLLFDKVQNVKGIDTIQVKILDKNEAKPVYSKNYLVPKDFKFDLNDFELKLMGQIYNDLYLHGEI